MIPTYRSFSKINLHLEVLGRRTDGDHELRTVFQSLDLCDSLTVEPAAGGCRLEVLEGDAPAGEANLAVRAARRFLERWAPGAGVRLGLRKRIPVGGGLGGGSGNAATVLLALRRLFGRPARVDELHGAAAELGADVPYFLVGGTALGRGRGDRVTPLPELPERTIWLLRVPLRVSTADIFAAWRELTPRPPLSRMGALVRGEEAGWAAVADGWNDLQQVVFERHPLIARAYRAALDAGATGVRMTGSGSTLFAWARDESFAEDLTPRLPAGCELLPTRTLARSSLESLRLES